MKPFILLIFFLAFLQTSFAQKYEYNIIGEHFSDTLYNNETATVSRVYSIVETDRKAIFEAPEDTTYIYHQIGEGENANYILDLYQICAPCFAEWNNLGTRSSVPFFTQVITQKLYTGEYLKVAIKKEYEKGTAAQFKTRKLYIDFPNQTYISDIARRYGITKDDLRFWNNLSQYAYEIENRRLIVGEIVYKYACPCLE